MLSPRHTLQSFMPGLVFANHWIFTDFPYLSVVQAHLISVKSSWRLDLDTKKCAQIFRASCSAAKLISSIGAWCITGSAPHMIPWYRDYLRGKVPVADCKTMEISADDFQKLCSPFCSQAHLNGESLCVPSFFRQSQNIQVNHKLGDKPLEFALPPFPLPCACPTHKLPIPKPDRFQHQSNKIYTKNIWKSAVCFGKSPRCWTIVTTYYIKSIPMKFACRPLFLFLVPVVACRREDSKKAWRLIPCIRASNLGHCSCCSWKSGKDLMKDVEKKPFRSVHPIIIQLSFNIFTWLQRTPHTWGRAVVTQGQLPVCQHVIKQHSRFFWLCSCNLHPEITWGLQGELSALTSLSKSSRVASPGLRPKVPFSIERFPQMFP